MIKHTLLIALACLASHANAGAASPIAPANSGAIITPDVATGFFQFQDGEFTTSHSGLVTVCFPDLKASVKNCNTPMTEAIPAGKKFAGFRLAYGSHAGGLTRRFLEVYYK